MELPHSLAVAENVKDKVKVVYGKKSEVEEKGTSALKTVTMTADKSVANAYTTDAIFLEMMHWTSYITSK
ncbi:MAG: hypothetical protein ACLU9V_06350 [Roseburia sp.]